MTGAAWATTAVLLTAAAPLPLRAADWGATLTLASEYAFRGVSRTDGVAAQGGLHVQSAAGGFAGLWASNIEPQPAQIGRVEANVNAAGPSTSAPTGARPSAGCVTCTGCTSPRSRFDWNKYSVSLNYADRLALTASLAPERRCTTSTATSAACVRARSRRRGASRSSAELGVRWRSSPRSATTTPPGDPANRTAPGTSASPPRGPVRHRARALRRQRRGATAVRPRGGGPALDRVGDVALPSPLTTVSSKTSLIEAAMRSRLNLWRASRHSCGTQPTCSLPARRDGPTPN